MKTSEKTAGLQQVSGDQTPAYDPWGFLEVGDLRSLLRGRVPYEPPRIGGSPKIGTRVVDAPRIEVSGRSAVEDLDRSHLTKDNHILPPLLTQKTAALTLQNLLLSVGPFLTRLVVQELLPGVLAPEPVPRAVPGREGLPVEVPPRPAGGRPNPVHPHLRGRWPHGVRSRGTDPVLTVFEAASTLSGSLKAVHQVLSRRIQHASVQHPGPFSPPQLGAARGKTGSTQHH